MPVISGILNRRQRQVFISRNNADTLLVAQGPASPCDADAAFAMFSGRSDGSVIIIDVDENACLGSFQVIRIVS